METTFRIFGKTEPVWIRWAPVTVKRGRQGYALFLVNSGQEQYPWYWKVEDQSGHSVASSDLYFRSKWDAKRSAFRLTDKIKHIYVEDPNGNRVREL